MKTLFMSSIPADLYFCFLYPNAEPVWMEPSTQHDRVAADMRHDLSVAHGVTFLLMLCE